ncbi:hypothetical protein ZIOFF_026156 [Zingiber officinale]|uniref:Uncharacterized protein n=1 Tax=Zingiber officinale TaxID=94328 RepID=A0A8J5GYP5_ZINOF|nr:hypothetical protein ZIOFF_026156 [Zingiber officinale]
MSVSPVSASDTHGNLDEQIAQLMQCKPLVEQEVTSCPFPRLFSSDRSSIYSFSDYWDLLSSAFGMNSKGSPKETLTILLRRVSMSSFVAADLGRLLPALSATQRNPRPDSPSFSSASKSLISFSSSFRGAPSTSAEVGARNGRAPVLAAGTKHLMGSLSKTEGLKFAVVRVLCEKAKEVLMEESNVQADITSFKTIPVRWIQDSRDQYTKERLDSVIDEKLLIF